MADYTCLVFIVYIYLLVDLDVKGYVKWQFGGAGLVGRCGRGT